MDHLSKDELIATAVIGDEAKRFMESEIGKFVLGLARQEVEMAKQDLLKVNPSDIEAVRKLQGRASFGEQFEDWLVGIMNEGEQSLQALRQQE